MANGSLRAPDRVASLTLAVVALLALCWSWSAPWWEMQARAPQYGQRTLIVEVNPRAVEGDVFEVDALGHYVGISKMENFAPLERRLAPFGLAVAILGMLAAPWLRRPWQRLLAVLPTVALPVFFLLDLDWTMARAANDRDPDASLNLVLGHVDTRLFGQYVLAQFKVTARPGIGLFLVCIAALLGLGLVFAVPLQLRKRKLSAKVSAAVAAVLCLLASLGARAEIVAPALRLPPVAGEAGSSVVVVKGNQSLAAAIDAASAGDTLLVAGIHRERVTVKKRLRLRGAEGAVLDGGGAGTVLRIEADGVEVDNLNIRGSGDVYTSEDAAVRIEHAADVQLRRLRIDDALFGIFAVQADRCLVEGSIITGKDLPTVRRGDGIRLWYSGGCKLLGNVLDRSRDLVIWYSSGTLVEDNVVRRSRYGLHYMFSDDNVFRRNRFEDDEVGAAIMYSRRITLEGNAFSFATGVSANGLLIKDADDIFVRGNRFVGNAIAIFLDGAPQSRGGKLEVRGNLFARNDIGVALQPSESGAAFWENAFIGNHVQVQIQGTGTAAQTQWSVGGRGNYWSDALVYDSEGGGVSTLPYRPESSYEVLADRYPSLAFFDGTPAADAIDMASRLFPLFAPRPKLTDAHPLVRPPLDDWTLNRGERAGHLAFAGGSIFALAAVLLWGARRAAS